VLELGRSFDFTPMLMGLRRATFSASDRLRVSCIAFFLTKRTSLGVTLPGAL